MKIKGTIVAELPEQSGVSKAGKPWQKREYIIETLDQYQKKVCIVVMDDAIQRLNLKIGQSFEFEVDVYSREYNGKWYTSVTAWFVNSISDNVQNTNLPSWMQD